MKILITGGSGQLGNELKRCLDTMQTEIGPIPEIYRNSQYDTVDYEIFDISDEKAVDSWFSNHAYDLVINCAAITNVDGCEADEEGAYKVNAIGPRNLAQAAERQGAKMVHVSTDYVFPGTNPTPRKEEDGVGPISAYGRTKLAGERMARQESSRCFIVRTAWLYGYVGRNFVKTMRKLGNAHDRITVVDDQLGNPTSANDLAYEILKIATTENYGVYHCTNEGTCSWAEFAQEIMRCSNIFCKVVPVTSRQYKESNPQSAERPHFSSLENARLVSTIGNEMRPWREALKMYIENLTKLGD